MIFWRCRADGGTRIFTCRGLDKGRVTDTHANSAFVLTTEGDHLSGCHQQPIGELPVLQSKQFAIFLYGTSSPPCDHTSSLLAEEIIIPPYPANSRDIVVFPPRHFDPTEVSVASFLPAFQENCQSLLSTSPYATYPP
jgi:hypothetical protein